MKVDYKEAAKFLLENDNYVIHSHMSPDGDTLGSAFALCGALQSIGKKAKVFCEDKIPKKFLCLKEGLSEEDFEVKIHLAVDVADLKLMSENHKNLGYKISLCLDHHISNTLYAERTLVVSSAAAACEVVYDTVTEMGISLNPQIARALYVGIATDTGCFKYSTTTSKTHFIAAKLLEQNFDADYQNYIHFQLKTRERLRIESAIYKDMEFYFGGKCAMITLTKALIAGASDDDSDGLSAIPRQIEGVDVGITVKEKNNKWKISIRTNHLLDAQKICKSLGGGGHVRAAGCSVTGTEKEAKDKIIAAVKTELEELGMI